MSNAAEEAGRKGGQSRSDAKIAAALKNGMRTRFQPNGKDNGKTKKEN